MNNSRFDWIIGVCNSAEDGVKIYRFRGTIQKTKEKLVELVNADKAKDSDIWEGGTEDVEWVCAEDNGLGYDLYAYGNYSDHHIDYTAKEYAHIDNI